MLGRFVPSLLPLLRWQDQLGLLPLLLWQDQLGRRRGPGRGGRYFVVTRQRPLVTHHNFMRAPAAARAWHTFGDARRALQERLFERFELLSKPLEPTRRDSRQPARRFKRLPNIHGAIYDRRASG